jgi:protein-disulfide isomerase
MGININTQGKENQIMPKMSKQVAVVWIILACVVTVFAARWIMTAVNDRQETQRASMRAKGPADAPIQIVEFIDFQCPACAHGAKLLKEYVEKHPGQIHMEVKHFPLMGMHKHSLRAAMYAECGGQQGKFWPVHDALMEKQAEWKGLDDAEATFKQIAGEAQLDPNKLIACLVAEDTVQTIYGHKEEGKALAVRSTPSYVINGELVVGPRNLTDQLNKLLPANEN